MANKEITFISDVLTHSALSTKKKTLDSLLEPTAEFIIWDLIEEKYNQKAPEKIMNLYEEYIEEYEYHLKNYNNEERGIKLGYSSIQSLWKSCLGLSGFAGTGTTGFIALSLLGITGIPLTIGVFLPAVIGGYYGQEIGKEIGTAHATEKLKWHFKAKLKEINRIYVPQLLNR